MSLSHTQFIKLIYKNSQYTISCFAVPGLWNFNLRTATVVKYFVSCFKDSFRISTDKSVTGRSVFSRINHSITYKDELDY